MLFHNSVLAYFLCGLAAGVFSLNASADDLIDMPTSAHAPASVPAAAPAPVPTQAAVMPLIVESPLKPEGQKLMHECKEKIRSFLTPKTDLCYSSGVVGNELERRLNVHSKLSNKGSAMSAASERVKASARESYEAMKQAYEAVATSKKLLCSGKKQIGRMSGFTIENELQVNEFDDCPYSSASQTLRKEKQDVDAYMANIDKSLSDLEKENKQAKVRSDEALKFFQKEKIPEATSFEQEEHTIYGFQDPTGNRVGIDGFLPMQAVPMMEEKNKYNSYGKQLEEVATCLEKVASHCNR